MPLSNVKADRETEDGSGKLMRRSGRLRIWCGRSDGRRLQVGPVSREYDVESMRMWATWILTLTEGRFWADSWNQKFSTNAFFLFLIFFPILNQYLTFFCFFVMWGQQKLWARLDGNDHTQWCGSHVGHRPKYVVGSCLALVQNSSRQFHNFDCLAKRSVMIITFFFSKNKKVIKFIDKL